MTREERIVRAAEAILDAAETPEYVRDEQVWAWARRDAEAALAVFEKAHTPTTPTDDERGWSTTDRQAASAEAHRRFDEWAETRGQDIAGASVNGFILGAEWWKARRTVQGEPSDALAEPSEAAVDAALKAAEGAGPLTPIRERLRVALRAAAAAEATTDGENR